jgi:hypothetical protein
MPNDKLSIIQAALAMTGNNIPQVADDGSEEWNMASVVYETSVDGLIEAHNWNFSTNIQTLVRLGAALDANYTDAYNKPADCLHVIWIRVNGVPIDYKIVNNQICVNASSQAVTVKYVRIPNNGSWPPMFVDCVRQSVMAGIYRGLNEDIAAANGMDAQALRTLQMARTRTDQEQPKRALFSSRLRAARQVRKPWQITPPAWGGSNTPR